CRQATWLLSPRWFDAPPSFKIALPGARANPSRSRLIFLALKPGLALRIKRRKRRPIEPGKLVLDLVADLALQVGEVAAAFGKLRQMCRVEREPRIRLNRVDAIFLVGEPSQHDTPTAFALFQEIVKATGTDNIAKHALDLCAL